MVRTHIIFGAGIASMGLLANFCRLLVVQVCGRQVSVFTATNPDGLLPSMIMYGPAEPCTGILYTSYTGPFELATMFLGLGVVYEIFQKSLAIVFLTNRIGHRAFQISLLSFGAYRLHCDVRQPPMGWEPL